ncbi:enoyl-CoA hydratase [Variovorax atrisoli]|uniref:oxepin-CoA hydrolase, alternative type n=1 Tax=Variovorax atrisoli TaxID=3394203 RepID=UPI000F7F27F3|nr:enoyl-CoA hydratase [Variovorax sp. 369]RTD95928.1 enoyl-CoA hydratase [Variovorax sp. 369]
MSTDNKTILISQEGAVRILTNSNPASRNAITPTLYAELSAALVDAQADPETGAIVFTGAGDFFCSGGDLNLLAKRRELPASERRQILEGLNNLIRALRDCSKPVIAAVEGGAAGAGLSMALACDMLVSARDAFFTVAYVKVGLTPDGGATAFLSEFVSRQVLTEMCLTGDRMPAERLHALGAVNRLTDKGAALAEAIALAAKVANGPERASARIKSLCRQAHRATLEEQLDAEAVFMVESQADAEAAEGIGAFLGKRKADFAALRGRKQGAS